MLWADSGIRPEEVLAELEVRMGTSGLAREARAASATATTAMVVRKDAVMAYDDDNVFAKILRGEIPCNKVYEDDHALAFHDINAQAPTHVLVIPRGKYVSWADFAAKCRRGGDRRLRARAVGAVARQLGLETPGYRLLANHGADANQEVPHLHVHIFGGRNLGRMLG